mmetsp:Transcript_3675/g.9913  ORF Transcript_3675/g.9913 Transcript_3675/m.9913 type:complete len:282 (+) Transcript_3675:314-1159(+)
MGAHRVRRQGPGGQEGRGLQHCGSGAGLRLRRRPLVRRHGPPRGAAGHGGAEEGGVLRPPPHVGQRPHAEEHPRPYTLRSGPVLQLQRGARHGAADDAESHPAHRGHHPVRQPRPEPPLQAGVRLLPDALQARGLGGGEHGQQGDGAEDARRLEHAGDRVDEADARRGVLRADVHAEDPGPAAESAQGGVHRLDAPRAELHRGRQDQAAHQGLARVRGPHRPARARHGALRLREDVEALPGGPGEPLRKVPPDVQGGEGRVRGRGRPPTGPRRPLLHAGSE